MVRHPSAGKFIELGLFDGIRSFEEFERRVESLSGDSEGATNKLRGDAFEVFASAYLATQRQHDAETVWPLSEAPLELLERTGLAGRDLGVDGLFRTPLGKVSAYQVKFRSGRPGLTWKEISTFMGLADSPNLSSRVLFTNCDEISSVINERTAFFCIRGADLDRMESADFEAIRSWLVASTVKLARKQPRPHQQEALDAILPALKEHDRVTAIMACGTGKTLVALWLAEHRQAKRIIVLLPSLALIRQTLHEWLKETSIPQLAYMCVCSDPSVTAGADSLRTNQSDLDFAVSTKPSQVAEFLNAPFEGVKIVFSTYQSAHVVGEANQGRQAFDLGIFDEAHKTAGRDGTNSTFALVDNNIAIAKRVFMTATPRHYNPHKRSRDGEASLIFSMDRPAVYGPRAYTLTFAEAARRGIICPYRIVISVITSDKLTNQLLSEGEVLVKGNPVRARTVANMICLRDAVEQYGVSKIFTFHKTVKSAAAFTSSRSLDLERHLPSFKGFHVNGDMPTTQREKQMHHFRKEDRALMSNARCLTEGVDVPSVDMVAFLSPRRSKVDIVQATGRAMRKSTGKTTGYILLPVYVEVSDGESVDEAVARADFGEVWDVLNSLQEQDDVLADVVADYAVSKATKRILDEERLRERIHVVGPLLTVEGIREAVTTQCLSQFDSTWFENYARLVEFKTRHGHCDVNEVEDAPQSLRSWVSAQRVRNNKGLLPSIYAAKLEEIGFTWDWQKAAAERTWMRHFENLKQFYTNNGHSNVPRTHEDSKLASWVWIQRQRRNGTNKQNDTIGRWQIELLDSLGFQWDRRGSQWQTQYERLRSFLKHGAWSDLSKRTSDTNTLTLYNWVRRQRKAQANRQLSESQIRQLDAINFQWEAPEIPDAWKHRLQQLKEFKDTHGHCTVTRRRNTRSATNELAAWSTHQRQLRRNGELDDEQIAMLDSLGFEWKLRDRGTWEGTFEELAAFSRENGHFKPPPELKKLRGFINAARVQFNKGTLPKERQNKLEAICFPWSADSDKDTIWETRLGELKAFKARYGHCDVPTNGSDRRLGLWVVRQRSMKRKSTLSDHKIAVLSDMGLDWIRSDERSDWEEHFKSLECNIESAGSLRLSLGDRRLRRWLYVQRRRMREGTLSPEKSERLKALGVSEEAFRKSRTSPSATQRWRILQEFNQQYGHCKIPRKYNKDPQLYNWLSQQRRKARLGKLPKDKLILLKELGISFDSESLRVTETWNSRYRQLAEFKGKHGHCYIPARWEENPTLGAWVHQQRTKIRSGKLSSEQAAKLIALGINDATTKPKSRWDDNYSALRDFHAKHGHCIVPWDYAVNKALRGWLDQQRQKIKSGRLSQDRISLLDALGVGA